MPELYHFTCHTWWHFIRSEGINRGEVPITQDRVLQFPGLTEDPKAVNQHWALGSALDKGAVRLTVQIPRAGRLLTTWRAFHEQHQTARRWYRDLDEASGWQARYWWIYAGTIPPIWITSHEILRPPSGVDAQLLDEASSYRSSREFLRDKCRSVDMHSILDIDPASGLIELKPGADEPSRLR